MTLSEFDCDVVTRATRIFDSLGASLEVARRKIEGLTDDDGEGVKSDATAADKHGGKVPWMEQVVGAEEWDVVLHPVEMEAAIRAAAVMTPVSAGQSPFTPQISGARRLSGGAPRTFFALPEEGPGEGRSEGTTSTGDAVQATPPGERGQSEASGDGEYTDSEGGDSEEEDDDDEAEEEEEDMGLVLPPAVEPEVAAATAPVEAGVAGPPRPDTFQTPPRKVRGPVPARLAAELLEDSPAGRARARLGSKTGDWTKFSIAIAAAEGQRMRGADAADERRRRLVQGHWAACVTSLQQESRAWLRLQLGEDAGREKEEAGFSWKMDSHEFSYRMRVRLAR